MALTSDQAAAVYFLLYLVVPVALYLVLAPIVWLVRKLRGGPKTDGENMGAA